MTRNDYVLQLGRLNLLQQARTGSLFPKLVAGISQRAAFDRQATTANATGQTIAQQRQSLDPRIQIVLPHLRERLPVTRSWGAPLRQRIEGRLNFGQRYADPLRHLDDAETSQDIAPVTPLVAARPHARNQAFGLVEMQRRDGQSAPFCHFAHSEKPAEIAR